jgi:starch synthase
MWDPLTRQGTGIVFNDFDVPAVQWAIHAALDFYKNQEGWTQLMRNGMVQDFSWDRQTGEYVKLYRDLTAKQD